MSKKYAVSIGLLSGLNYGSEGCREGLWRLTANILEKEKVDFVMLVGGLVDSRALLEKLKGRMFGVKAAEHEEVTQEFIKDAVEHLRKNIPKIPNVKLYVVTSPAYDGWIGERIAQGIAEKRKDILLYRAGSDRLEIKQLNRMLGVYAPKKGVWMRGDYFDTPVLRVLKDEIKRSTRGIGDINVVGCHASAVFNPGDSTDVQLPYASLPALYKIAETRTAENQVGFRILKAKSDNLKEAVMVTYNLKDLVSSEWALVQTPPDSSEVQKVLVDILKERGPLTVGQFSDFTGYKRMQVKEALDALLRRRVSKSWPGLYTDKVSKRFYFLPGWFQEKLEYPETKCDKEDSIMAFGCLHAGCKHTDMKFFRDVLPELMLQHNVRTLCGAGDFIEGLKHDLMVKGELLGGTKYPLNYNRQEQLSAYLVSCVLMKVFRARVNPILTSMNPEHQDLMKLEEAVLSALPEFLYIPGNHCEWTAPLGFDSLSVFGPQLRSLVAEEVGATLSRAKFYLPNLQKVINTKIVRLDQCQSYKLESGLTISELHPYMSRTKTPSIRAQEALQKSPTNVVIVANFHTAEAVEQWEFKMGQRVCLVAGTIKRRSGFEDTKMKTVDFGIVFANIRSNGKRISRTETAFFSTPTENLEESNEAILADFNKRLGL